MSDFRLSIDGFDLDKATEARLAEQLNAATVDILARLDLGFGNDAVIVAGLKGRINGGRIVRIPEARLDQVAQVTEMKIR